MKLVLKIVGSLLALAVVLVALLLFFVDANRFKPAIESLAKKQNVLLDIEGDLTWRLWPRFGFNANDISVAALDSPEQPIAQLRETSFLIAIKPLFSSEFQVDHIVLDGAKIRLAVDEEGRGNWEAFTLEKTEKGDPSDEPAASDGESSLNLRVDRFQINQASLSFSNRKTGQNLDLEELNLDVTEINTLGDPFLVKMAWLLEMRQDASKQKLRVAGDLSHSMAFDEDFTKLKVHGGQVSVRINDEPDGGIDIRYELALEGLKDRLRYDGQLEVSDFNARKTLGAFAIKLDTANLAAVTSLGFSSSFRGDTEKIRLEPLALRLDKSKFSGSVSIENFSTQTLAISLSGDRINVDDYLPAPSDDTAKVQADTEEDTPLPLDMMRTLDVDASLTMNAVILKKAKLENVKASVKAKNGVIDEKFSANSYDGKISLNSRTDANPPKADINFDAKVEKFEVSPLLADLELNKNFNVSGAIDLTASGVLRGESVNELLESINSKAAFSGAQMRLSPLNIEEKFCKAVNLLTQKSSTVDWEDFTELREFDGEIVWQNQVIQLDKFKAGVSQLLLASSGRIDLASDRYEFKLPLKFTTPDDAEKFEACRVSSSNYWVDRGLSLLRCRGSLENIQPLKDCGLDSDGLKSLTKDFAEYKLREKHGAKIDAAEKKLNEKKKELKEKKQAIKSDAQEEVDEKKAEAKKKIEEEKERFLDRLKKKLNKPDESGDGPK